MITICGIFGIAYGPEGAGAEEWSPVDFMQLMFPAIIHRGPHAWGYMYHQTGAEHVDYFKMPGKCDTKAAMENMVMPDTGLDWMVCHVRYATNGKPEININNHPIKHGDIIGVHNGVLREWQSIIKETGREDDTALVDSEAIFAAVNKWGMRGGLARIKGDMVSIFTDLKKPETLRIARSHGRPLVYATTPAGSLIFASEDVVLAATGIALKGPVSSMKNSTNVLYTVRGGKITERTQYKAPEPIKKSPAHWAPVVRADWRSQSTDWDNVSGITDYFESQQRGGHNTPPLEPRRSVGHGSGHSGSGVPRRESPLNTAHLPLLNKDIIDRFGGKYIGSNVWELPDGNLKNAEEYVEWCVRGELVKARDRAQALLNKNAEVALEKLPATEPKVIIQA